MGKKYNIYVRQGSFLIEFLLSVHLATFLYHDTNQKFKVNLLSVFVLRGERGEKLRRDKKIATKGEN